MKLATRTCLAGVAVAVLTVASLSSHAGGNHYRWVDERGAQVHSDRPPPPDSGIDYEVISPGSSLMRQVDAEEGAVPAETEPSVGNEFEQVDTQRDMQVMKKNPENCQRARDNLKTLETAARIKVRNDQGEFRYLSEEEKEIERQKARDTMNAHCE